jgi:integrase/recombinase XerC
VIERFEAHLEIDRGLSAGTVSLYRKDASRFLAHLQKAGSADPLPASLARGVIGGYLAEVREQGAGQRTVARMTSGLRRFFRFAHREGLLDAEPEIRVREKLRSRRLPRAVPEERLAETFRQMEAREVSARDRALA